MTLNMLVVALFVTAVAPAQVVDLPPGGETVLDARNPSGLQLNNSPDLAGAMQITTPEGQPFAEAVRVDIRREMGEPAAIQLVASTRGRIDEGDVLAMEIFLRGSAERSPALTAVVTAQLRELRGKLRVAGEMKAYAGRQWRQQILAFESPVSLADGEHILAIQLGTYRQTVEIGGIRILNYRKARRVESLPKSRIAYSGMEPDAPWRKAAAERIEQIRKSDLTVRVIDQQGRPVEKAKVHVKMQRHAFGFGTAVRAAELARFDDRTLDAYRAAIEKYFNRVVFENDLTWQAWETAKTNQDAAYRKEYLDAAFEWLRLRSLGVRGHWGAWGPVDEIGRGPGNQPDATLPQRVLSHMQEKFTALDQKVMEWDAINHPAGSWAPTLERRFGLDYYAEVMRRAREWAPPMVSIWLNESGTIEGGGRADEYLRVTADLFSKGAEMNGVAFQGHFDPASVRGIEEIYATFDRFVEYVPNLQITELDIDTTDEDFQAQYLSDILTIAFSHHNFCAVLLWGFWEGLHSRPDAALWRTDWTIKPAGEAYLDLVMNQWWTDVEVETGADGLAQVRGFQGAYEITAAKGGATNTVTTTLTPEGTWVEAPLNGVTTAAAPDRHGPSHE